MSPTSKKIWNCTSTRLNLHFCFFSPLPCDILYLCKTSTLQKLQWSQCISEEWGDAGKGGLETVPAIAGAEKEWAWRAETLGVLLIYPAVTHRSGPVRRLLARTKAESACCRSSECTWGGWEAFQHWMMYSLEREILYLLKPLYVHSSECIIHIPAKTVLWYKGHPDPLVYPLLSQPPNTSHKFIQRILTVPWGKCCSCSHHFFWK